MTSFVKVVAATAALLMGAEAAVAQQAGGIGGTASDPSAVQLLNAPQLAIGTVGAANSYASAQFGIGGVGLRNRGAGAINVSGVVSPVKAAFLYWAVITSGAPPAAVRTIRLQRQFPLPVSAATTLAGTLVGSGATPCWGGTGIFVYKASVPLTIANGNGLYGLTLAAGASGRTGGENPWTFSSVYPLFEGASLVIVGTGGYRVALYDRGLAGKTFINSTSGLSYALALPVSAPGASTIFSSIGADGQIGLGVSATAALSGDYTTANGVRIAGPGSVASDSDWNGAAAGPLPQLWDNTIHDISIAVRRGATSLPMTVGVAASASTDCLVPVANLIALR